MVVFFCFFFCFECNLNAKDAERLCEENAFFRISKYYGLLLKRLKINILENK